MNDKPRALVVGMGIGGLATALRLHDVGWDTVLVERAPERRSAGYFVALFGTGRAAAERLGVLDAIGDRAHLETVNYDVARDGGRRPGMGYSDLPGAPRLLLRGDIEAALFDAVEPLATLRFGTTPVAVDEHRDGVDVTLRTTTAPDATAPDATAPGDAEPRTTESTERFDLVVGADGMRSTVRRLVFGPDADFFRPLHHIISAATLTEPVPGYGPSDGIVLAEPGRAAWVFPLAGHPPVAMLTYRTRDEDAEFRRPHIESLRRAFGPEPLGPVLGNILEQYEAAGRPLFDSAHQVEMPTWHTDRVVLVGDSAWSLTAYSGMGASTALAGADYLGTVLQRNPGSPARALREWEARLRPFAATHQEIGRRDLVMFVPQTRRDKAGRTMSQVLLGTAAGKRMMRRVFAGKFAPKSVDVAAA